MNSLLNIVKEQGIVDIIDEYKEEIERVELDNKINENNEKINNIRKLCIKRDYLVDKSTKSEIDNTLIPFSIPLGQFLPLDNHYMTQIKKGYKKAFDNMISEKIEKLRKTNLELQMEKLLKYGEEVEDIDEEDEELLENINENEPTIHIGVTGHNNLYGATLDYGTTGYNNVNDINLGVTLDLGVTGN